MHDHTPGERPFGAIEALWKVVWRRYEYPAERNLGLATSQWKCAWIWVIGRGKFVTLP